MSFTIRNLGINDLEAYRALRLTALEAHPESYTTSAENWPVRETSVSALRSRATRPFCRRALLRADVHVATPIRRKAVIKRWLNPTLNIARVTLL